MSHLFQVLQDAGHLLDAGDGLAGHRAAGAAVATALQEGPGRLQAVEATHALAAGVQEDTLVPLGATWCHSWLING